jgi:hypothetical protein
MWASRNGANVEWSLGGRLEFYDARPGEWRASVALPLRPCGAFSGDESEEVLGGDRILPAGYRYNVKT